MSEIIFQPARIPFPLAVPVVQDILIDGWHPAGKVPGRVLWKRISPAVQNSKDIVGDSHYHRSKRIKEKLT